MKLFAMIAFVLVSFALINRLRGGMWPANLLPGRPVLWVALPVFLLSFGILGSWIVALWFTGTWLLWGIPAWGRWYSLGRVPREEASGKSSRFEELIEKIGGESDYVCFLIRCTAPLIVAPWLLPIGPLQVLSYELGQEIAPGIGDGTAIGEAVTGGCWGVGLLITHMLFVRDSSFLFL